MAAGEGAALAAGDAEITRRILDVLSPPMKLVLYIVASRRAARLEEIVREYNELAPRLGLEEANLPLIKHYVLSLKLFGLVRVFRSSRIHGGIRSVKLHPDYDASVVAGILSAQLGVEG